MRSLNIISLNCLNKTISDRYCYQQTLYFSQQTLNPNKTFKLSVKDYFWQISHSQNPKKMKKCLKIVALSDNHTNLTQFGLLKQRNISGDIFIHAGDFTRYGGEQGFIDFFHQLDKINFKHKIVIAGNHQISLDRNTDEKDRKRTLELFPCGMNRETIKKELAKRCIYLEHESVVVEGVKIFGSPYSQFYSKLGSFQYKVNQDEQIWKDIPADTELLITHSPPAGILDLSRHGINGGSPALLKKVREIKPKLHLFGHIHEGYGREKRQDTLFANVATKLAQFRWEELV